MQYRYALKSVDGATPKFTMRSVLRADTRNVVCVVVLSQSKLDKHLVLILVQRLGSLLIGVKLASDPNHRHSIFLSCVTFTKHLVAVYRLPIRVARFLFPGVRCIGPTGVYEKDPADSASRGTFGRRRFRYQIVDGRNSSRECADPHSRTFGMFHVICGNLELGSA